MSNSQIDFPRIKNSTNRCLEYVARELHPTTQLDYARYPRFPRVLMYDTTETGIPSINPPVTCAVG